MCLSMLPKTSTFKSLSYCKTPFNIPRFGRNYFSYTQHVGISVTVAQRTFAFKCLSQRLTFVSSSASTSLFAPSPRSELTVELAEHQNTLRVFCGILSSKSPGQKAVSWVCSTQPTSVHVTNQVSATHRHIVEHLHVQMQNLSIQGKNSNSCKKLLSNQNDFSLCQHQKSPAQSGATASRALCCPHTSTSMFLPFTCAPRLSTGFFGGKNQPNSIKRKSYLYVIRTSQAQQVWAKRVITVQNKPEIYLWPTLKKKKIQNRTKTKASSLCPNPCFHTAEGMGRSA